MTEDQAFDYLYDRAARHDMTVTELLSATPDSVSDCYIESAEFWEHYDISHKYPQSTHPELASDPSNIVPEDPSLNRARGAEVMTSEEIAAAEAAAEVTAARIDSDTCCTSEITFDVWPTWGFA